ncbi:N-acetylglucosamine kinase [uncultured Friedmanniella sp.]|uniref:N-acetylglucosamine kinase n=1 Tax=uncultured Friedmanniella sp. TaxID=335381 RepID=UPI0035CB3522
MSRYFLGIDAGNSKTVALLADETGEILGRGRGGVGDIYGTATEELAVDAVVAAAEAALADAGVSAERVSAAALRLAGVDWAEDERYWEDAAARRLPGLRQVSIRNDGFALLRCGTVSGVGVAVTAGTGPAVAARGHDGQEYCASWWIQHALGGLGLGEAAFRAVVDAEIGLRPPTLLRAELLTLYGHHDVADLLYAFTRRGSARSGRDYAAAARSVLRAASASDAVALEMVRSASSTFAGLARVAAERTGLVSRAHPATEPVPVVLGGSLLTSELPAYREALVKDLRRELGAVRVAATAASPVAGALLDALAEGGVELDQERHDRVLTTSHPADFLLT